MEPVIWFSSLEKIPVLIPVLGFKNWGSEPGSYLVLTIPDWNRGLLTIVDFFQNSWFWLHRLNKTRNPISFLGFKNTWFPFHFLVLFWNSDPVLVQFLLTRFGIDDPKLSPVLGDNYLVWQVRITCFGLVRKNWAGNGSKFGFSSGTGILELGIKLDLVLKPELEPNLDQNQNWFFCK